MTETQGPPNADQQQSNSEPQQPGVDRQHLRHYEDLRRSVTDRKIAGVAGGLGRHLGIDPTVLRVLFVVLCFFGGAGLILYGAAWLLVPEDGHADGNIRVSPSTRNTLLIAAGVVAALVLVGGTLDGVDFPWPLFVLGGGVLLYMMLRDRSSRSGGGVPAPYGPPPAAYGATDAVSYGAPDAPYGAPDAASYEQPPAPPWAAPIPAPYQPPARRRTGPLLFGPTLALVAIALGALGLVEAAGGHVADAAYPALALAVVGVMLLVGSVLGRAGGLILLGLVATVALAVTAVVGSIPEMDHGDARELTATPLTTDSVRSSYYLPTGRILLDLSDVRDARELAGRSIDVGARAGELVVVLPEGVATSVTADVSGPGQIDLPGKSTGGVGNTASQTYGDGTDPLTIRAHLVAGHIDVRTN